MEINLERGDLLKLDAISNRGTLKLLPLGKKGKVSMRKISIIAVLYISILLQFLLTLYCLLFIIRYVLFLYSYIQQKLLVCDDSGNLSCYEFKKGEPQVF